MITRQAIPYPSFEFEQIKPSEIWRFYIDGYRQLTPEGIEKGISLFDVAEPGYMRAMLDAHEYMMQTFELPLTPQLIVDFHKKALGRVENTANRNLKKFRDKKNADFGLLLNEGEHDLRKKGNVSHRGLNEFLTSMQNQPNPLACYIIFSDISTGGSTFDDQILQKALAIQDQQGIASAVNFLEKNIIAGHANFFVTEMTHEEIQYKVTELINHYQYKIQQALNDDEKLEAIIILIQSIERLHPFLDGNCRTFCMLLLNRELILNGFPPTMLDNPNRFDLFSINELKDEIRQGWKYANQYKSEISHFPSFKILCNLLANQPHMHQSLTLVKQISDMTLPNAIQHLSTHLNTFNEGGNITNTVFGRDTKNYKVAKSLLKEMKKMALTPSNQENQSIMDENKTSSKPTKKINESRFFEKKEKISKDQSDNKGKPFTKK